MSRIPRWLRIVLVVVAVLVAVGLILPYFLDANRYRGTIVSAIEKETGRKAQIGNIRAKLIPRVGFVIENFSLSNPPGFPEGHLLTVEAIRGSLAWWPLLHREFQLSAIELVRPKIWLINDERGHSNYDFPAKKKEPAADASAGFTIADIDSIELTGVEVTVGQIGGRKRSVIPSLRARNINAELGEVALDAKRIKQWEADADLDDVVVEVAGLKPVEFKSGSVKLRKGKLESNFKAALGKAAEVKGTLSVADVEKGPAVFELRTALLDLDQLAAASQPAPPSPAPTPRKSELVAQGRLIADRVRWAPYEATQAVADIRIFTDRVEMPLTMALYDGSLGVSTRLDRRQAPPRFSANVEVKKLDVAKLMAAAPGTRQKMTGTSEVTLQVFGSLGSSLLNSLSGNGNFAVRNGKLPGFDMGGTMQTMAKVQRVLTFGAGSAESFKGETPFDSIVGDLAIGGGRVASQHIHLDSPSGTVDMRGSFGFDQTLAYDGQAVLMGGSSGSKDNPVSAITGVLSGVMKQTVGRISVPFSVRGTFQNPKIGPGHGVPTFSTTSPTQAPTPTQPQQQPQKKKSILDLFKKP